MASLLFKGTAQANGTDSRIPTQTFPAISRPQNVSLPPVSSEWSEAEKQRQRNTALFQKTVALKQLV